MKIYIEYSNTSKPYGGGNQFLNNLKFYLKKKTQVTIARIPNVYGKWSKPNYNSFISYPKFTSICSILLYLFVKLSNFVFNEFISIICSLDVISSG